jgi:hypothetical protein
VQIVCTIASIPMWLLIAMSDTVATALISACVTLGLSLIAGFFGVWKTYLAFRETATSAKEAVAVGKENTKAIEKVAVKADEVHAVISQLDQFRAETAAARSAAASRLEEVRGDG